jgi:hypothetical protein
VSGSEPIGASRATGRTQTLQVSRQFAARMPRPSFRENRLQRIVSALSRGIEPCRQLPLCAADEIRTLSG